MGERAGAVLDQELLLGDEFAQTLSDHLRRLRVRVRHRNDEFLATEPTRKVDAAQSAAQPVAGDGRGWMEREVATEYGQIRDAAYADTEKPYSNDQFESAVTADERRKILAKMDMHYTVDEELALACASHSGQEMHTRIATIWSAILGHPITPWQVALMMAGLKIARLSHAPLSEDSWVDAVGYLALGAELTSVNVHEERAP